MSNDSNRLDEIERAALANESYENGHMEVPVLSDEFALLVRLARDGLRGHEAHSEDVGALKNEDDALHIKVEELRAWIGDQCCHGRREDMPRRVAFREALAKIDELFPPAECNNVCEPAPSTRAHDRDLGKRRDDVSDSAIIERLARAEAMTFLDSLPTGSLVTWEALPAPLRRDYRMIAIKHLQDIRACGLEVRLADSDLTSAQ